MTCIYCRPPYALILSRPCMSCVELTEWRATEMQNRSPSAESKQDGVVVMVRGQAAALSPIAVSWSGWGSILPCSRRLLKQWVTFQWSHVPKTTGRCYIITIPQRGSHFTSPRDSDAGRLRPTRRQPTVECIDYTHRHALDGILMCRLHRLNLSTSRSLHGDGRGYSKYNLK